MRWPRSSPSLRNLTLVMAAVAMTIATAIALWRGLWPRHDPSSRHQRFADSRTYFDQLQMHPFETRTDLETVLAEMRLQDSDLVSLDQAQALRTTLTDTLFFYYLSEDLKAYKNWRRTNGYTLDSREGIEAYWPISESRLYLQRFPEASRWDVIVDGDLEETFDIVWRISRQVGKGANQPRRVAADSTGILTVFRIGTASDPGRPVLDGELTTLAWHGGVSMGCRRWWRPERSLSAALEENGQVLLAQTGIAFEFGNDTRRPLLFTHFWDEHRGVWQLEAITLTNFPENELVWPLEF